MEYNNVTKMNTGQANSTLRAKIVQKSKFAYISTTLSLAPESAGAALGQKDFPAPERMNL